MEKQKINHGAVWLVIFLAQVLIVFWYQIQFEDWLALNGLTEDFFRDNISTTPFITNIFATAIFAYTLAWIFARMGIRSVWEGLKAGLIMGFAFTYLPVLTHHLLAFRPTALAWADGGANLLIWIVAGAILGAWTKK